jgi:hypothetical protein
MASALPPVATTSSGFDPGQKLRLAQRALDVLHQEGAALGGHGALVVEEGLVEPHGAHRERHRRVRRLVGEQGELDAAAADVDQQRAAALEVDRVAHRHEHQPRLLDAFDDVELDARLALGALDEQVGVLRLAHGAGGHGAVAVDAGLLHHVAEGLERVDGLERRGGREPAGEEDIVPEAHRRALGGDLAHLIGGERLDDPEAHRVGSDIDGCEAGHCVAPLFTTDRARRV